MTKVNQVTTGEFDELLQIAIQENDSEAEYAEAMEKLKHGLDELGISESDIAGVMGAPIFNGFISTVEKNPALSGTQKYVTFQNLLINTSIVAAGVRYFLNMLGNAKWSVTPADESEEAQKFADFVIDVMGDMHRSWESVVRKGAMYRFHGFSVQEWIPKMREDGRIGFFDVAPRPQSTIEKWNQDKNGYITSVTQRDPVNANEYTLHMWKLVYLIDDSLTDSPEGLGIFRHLVKSVDTLNRYLELEGFGFETDLRGIPVGKAPLQVLNTLVDRKLLSVKQRDAILTPLKSFITHHVKNPKLGLMLDSAVYTGRGQDKMPSSSPQWGLDLLTSQSTSQGEIASAIDRLTHDVARSLGVQQLLLGSGKVGTQALSKDNSKNFLLIVSSSLKELGRSYQSQLWDVLWHLNGFPENMKPKVVPEDVQLNEVESITKALRDMKEAGAALHPDDPAINEVRQLLGLSRATKLTVEEYLELKGESKDEPEKKPDSNVSGKTESEKD